MTAQALARTRKRFLNTMLTQDAIIYREQDNISDGMGGRLPNPSAGTAVKCRVMRQGTTSQVVTTGDNPRAEGVWDIALPAGIDAIRPALKLGDVVTVTGDASYQVMEPGSPQTDAITEHYLAKRIE